MPTVQRVVFEPAKPKAGDCVNVQVLGKDGQPLDAADGSLVTINGVPGAVQYVQVPVSGESRFVVKTTGSGEPQTKVVTLDVAEAPSAPTVETTGNAVLLEAAGTGPLVLSLHPQPGAAHGATFSIAPVGMWREPARVTAHGLNTSVAAALLHTAATKPEARALRTRVAAAAAPAKTARAAAAASELHVEKPVGDVVASGLIKDIPQIHLPAPSGAPVYEWDFGDGTKLTTTDAFVNHDFEAALGTDKEWQQFDVKVTVTAHGVSTTLIRTVAVHNSYVALRQRGWIVAPVQTSEFARKAVRAFVATATVRNRENQTITLSQRRVVPIMADPEADSDLAAVESIGAITIGAGETATIPLQVSFDQVPSDASGFCVHFAGSAADGTAVRVSAYLDVHPEDRTPGLKLGQIAIDHLLQQARLTPGVANELGVTLPPVVTNPIRKVTVPPLVAHGPAAALHRSLLAGLAQGQQPVLTRSLATGPGTLVAGHAAAQLTANLTHLAQSPDLLDSNPIALRLPESVRQSIRDVLANAQFDPGAQVAAPQEGAECDPDNLPDEIPDGWACQATGEQRQVTTPGRFMNARKGDVVLSPGGNGLIGGLLCQVTPPQRYSHSGIMTRNHDEITHCTMSEDRLAAYPNGSDPTTGQPAPTDGFQPDALKYGWPGVITQSVYNAVEGEWLVDPETKGSTDASYEIHAFGAQPEGADIGGAWTIIPPLVVKPDPMQETTQVRSTLRNVADLARQQEGKAHYRFYCYTDPTIGLNSTAPSLGKWSDGTFPAVCSAFIWQMMRRSGVALESAHPVTTQTDLEQTDQAAGAQVDAHTTDGTYLYTAGERRTAADWFYNALYQKAHDKAGALGTLFTDAPDDIANQMLNTFASDWADTDAKDSDAWKNTEDANAVSPDNIMFWDNPAAGGLYGYAEPLIYRAPRWDTIVVHKWHKAETKGKITGHVRNGSGGGLGGVTIQVYDGMQTHSADDGSFELDDVPYGSYQLTAQLVQQDGSFWSATESIALNSPQIDVNVLLQPPPADFRRITISGTFQTEYTYGVVVQTEDKKESKNFLLTLDVGPDQRHTDAGATHDVEDAHADLHVWVDWEQDHSATVHYKLSLHDASYEHTFSLGADCYSTWWAACSADNDNTRVDFTARNDVRQA